MLNQRIDIVIYIYEYHFYYRIRTEYVSTVYITSQTLNHFTLHYFVIIHCYPLLFDIIIQKENFNLNYLL